MPSLSYFVVPYELFGRIARCFSPSLTSCSGVLLMSRLSLKRLGPSFLIMVLSASLIVCSVMSKSPHVMGSELQTRKKDATGRYREGAVR